MNRQALTVLAIVVVAFSTATYLRPPSPVPEEDWAVEMTIPDESLLQLVALEHGPAASDLLWLSIVQNLGRRHVPSPLWTMVERNAYIAAGFDPRNYVIYLGTGVMLTHYARRVEASTRLLLKGADSNPDNPKLWVQLGYNAYFVSGHPKRAAEFWSKAAGLPGAPHYVGGLASMARYQAGDSSEAIAMARHLLGTMEPGIERNFIEFTLKELESERRFEAYDEACLAYFEAEGRWPQTASLLHEEGFAKEPPMDFYDHPIYLDIDDSRNRPCIARTDELTMRQFERAAELVGSEARIRSAAAERTTTSTPTTSREGPDQ